MVGRATITLGIGPHFQYFKLRPAISASRQLRKPLCPYFLKAILTETEITEYQKNLPDASPAFRLQT